MKSCYLKVLGVVSAVALGGYLAASVASAQDTTGGVTGGGPGNTNSSRADADDGFDMGWIGLAGLAGLAGLMPRKGHDRVGVDRH